MRPDVYEIMVKVFCVFIKMKSGLSVSRTGSRTMTLTVLPTWKSIILRMNSFILAAGKAILITAAKADDGF
mgnify:CR=1 FL=1